MRTSKDCIAAKINLTSIMKLLREILHLSAEYLSQKKVSNPRRQAEEVIADALKMKRLDLYLQFDRPLNDEELKRCRESVQRRSLGEPAQYIRGEVSFLDCTISVNSSVLIPRQETEILVSKVIDELEKKGTKGKVLWDICCGSGCIGIAIKKTFPELDVFLSDISPEAIEVARLNAKRNGVEVSCIQGDLLQPFQGQMADYVVCNPPYVSFEDYEHLEREVREFEPKVALVAGNGGTAFYRRLSEELSGYLKSPARVWLEIGHNQGEAISQLFKAPMWKKVYFESDWSGNHRFFFLEFE